MITKHKTVEQVSQETGIQKGTNHMTTREIQARQTVIRFLMLNMNMSHKESIACMKELEANGLIGFEPNGNFRIRKA